MNQPVLPPTPRTESEAEMRRGRGALYFVSLLSLSSVVEAVVASIASCVDALLRRQIASSLYWLYYGVLHALKYGPTGTGIQYEYR